MIYNTDFTKQFLDRNIRPSVQRVAIYSYIAINKNHPTAETVYLALKDSYPTLSRTTVYNTLHLFTENGLVQSIKIEENEIRYDADISAHIHFKCSSCGSVYDVVNKNTQEIYNNCVSSLPKQFKPLRTEINMWGFCNNCNGNK